MTKKIKAANQLNKKMMKMKARLIKLWDSKINICFKAVNPKTKKLLHKNKTNFLNLPKSNTLTHSKNFMTIIVIKKMKKIQARFLLNKKINKINFIPENLAKICLINKSKELFMKA